MPKNTNTTPAIRQPAPRIQPPTIARAAYPKPPATLAEIALRAQHAGKVAEQAAQMVEHFAKTLPDEREEWEPPLDFRTLALHCEQIRYELLEYTTWAEHLPPTPTPSPSRSSEPSEPSEPG